MKKVFVSLTVLLMAVISIHAQELQEIKLGTPNKARGSAVTKALADRRSDRSFETREISQQDIADLLWAANGVNRPDGKRTAPTAMNRQEIDVYLVNKDGAYLYDAAAHTLKPVAKGDFREEVAGSQKFDPLAPVWLVIVANLDKLGDPSAEQTRMIAAMDAGIVCQNINIFCAAVGLSTVPRATFDKAALTKTLQLSDKQYLMLNNPVGYLKK